MRKNRGLGLFLTLVCFSACKPKTDSSVKQTAEANSGSCVDYQRQFSERAAALKAEQDKLRPDTSEKELSAVSIADVIKASGAHPAPAVKVVALGQEIAMLETAAKIPCAQLFAGDNGVEGKDVALTDKGETDLDYSKPLLVTINEGLVDLLQSKPDGEGRFFGVYERSWYTTALFLRGTWEVIVRQLIESPIVLKAQSKYKAYAYTSIDSWVATGQDGSRLRPSRSYIYAFSPIDGAVAFDGYFVVFHAFLDGQQRTVKLSDLNSSFNGDQRSSGINRYMQVEPYK